MVHTFNERRMWLFDHITDQWISPCCPAHLPWVGAPLVESMGELIRRLLATHPVNVQLAGLIEAHGTRGTLGSREYRRIFQVDWYAWPPGSKCTLEQILTRSFRSPPASDFRSSLGRIARPQQACPRSSRYS